MAARNRPPLLRSKVTAVAVALVLTLSIAVAGGMLTRRQRVQERAAAKLAPQTSGTPSIEYFYAGSRLIATEQPTAPAPNPPTNLVASATNVSAINLTWTASQGTVDHYIVKRSSNAGGFQTIASNVTATIYPDSGLNINTTYVYEVLAAADPAGNNLSGPSNLDYATTVAFTTDPAITPGQTIVMAQHVIDLRTAVNAVRTAAGLGSCCSSPTLTQMVTVVAAQHIIDLRNGVNNARQSLGVPQYQFNDSTLTPGSTQIKAIHVTDLRHAVKGVGY
jgi:hypothetical protein